MLWSRKQIFLSFLLADLLISRFNCNFFISNWKKSEWGKKLKSVNIICGSKTQPLLTREQS